MTEGENGEDLDLGVEEHVLMDLAGIRTEDKILERRTPDLDPEAGELVLMDLDEVEKEKTGDRILETEETQKAMNHPVEAQAYM